MTQALRGAQASAWRKAIVKKGPSTLSFPQQRNLSAIGEPIVEIS
jgi:hypothetical protein